MNIFLGLLAGAILGVVFMCIFQIGKDTKKTTEIEMLGGIIKLTKNDIVLKSKIKEIKKENEKRINKMRPCAHISPFNFGVLNGIDECCRKLLKDK